MAITPLRKTLITLSDVTDNAKALARRLESTTDEQQRAQLSSRLRFNLREIATEATSALSLLEKK